MQIFNHLHGLRTRGLSERPQRHGIVAEIDDQRAGGFSRIHAGGADKARAISNAVYEVEQSKRNVFWVLCQRLRRNGTRFLGGLRLGRTSAEVTEHHEAALSNHLFGYFMHYRGHAPNPGGHGFIGHGAVGDGPVGLFGETMALNFQEDVVGTRCLTTVIWSLDQRADDVPDLRPAFARRLTHGLRMLRPQTWLERIVVDLAKAGPPPQEHLKTIGE